MTNKTIERFVFVISALLAVVIPPIFVTLLLVRAQNYQNDPLNDPPGHRPRTTWINKQQFGEVTKLRAIKDDMIGIHLQHSVTEPGWRWHLVTEISYPRGIVEHDRLAVYEPIDTSKMTSWTVVNDFTFKIKGRPGSVRLAFELRKDKVEKERDWQSFHVELE